MVLLVAAWIELRPAPMVDHPFAATDLPPGSVLDGSALEWRPVPAGALPPVTPHGVTSVAIPAGTPLVAALIRAERPPIPEGWWTMQLEFSPDLVPGMALQLVVIPGPGDDPQPPIPAVVVASPAAESFSRTTPGLVAVPPEAAADAAVAASAGRIAVLAGN